MIDWLAHIFLYIKRTSQEINFVLAWINSTILGWLLTCGCLDHSHIGNLHYAVDQFNLFLQTKNEWLDNDSVFFLKKQGKLIFMFSFIFKIAYSQYL
jgi:hypothetical protein